MNGFAFLEMKMPIKFPALVAALLLFGCKREAQESSQSVSTNNQTISIEPGTRAAESENWGYLALRIVRAHENQKLLDQAPWHAPGGDWTFLECEVDKQPSAQVITDISGLVVRVGQEIGGCPNGCRE